MFKPRDYQEKGSDEGAKQCLERGWCYLAFQVRIGKTLTSIMIASKIKAKKLGVFVCQRYSSQLRHLRVSSPDASSKLLLLRVGSDGLCRLSYFARVNSSFLELAQMFCPINPDSV